jgi:predicted metal-dependent hydrolase
VQFEFLFDRARATEPVGASQREASHPDENWLRVGMRQVRLHLVRHPRARRYVLRLRADGTARVTIPRRGSWLEGRRFANRNIRWLEKQLVRQASRSVVPQVWTAGTEILFRGEKVLLERGETPQGYELLLGSEVVSPATSAGKVRTLAPAVSPDLRPAVEAHLRALAARELPVRVVELARLHQFEVRRVSVRNQRSRWGYVQGMERFR